MSSISWRANVKHHPAQDTTGVVDVVTTFFTSSRARPAGAPSGQLRRGSERERGSPEGERVNGREARRRGQGWKGHPSAGGRQPGPLPLARQRTGAGRCRHAVSPAPARRRSSPSRTPVTAPARASRAVLPRRATLTPRKDHHQGRAEGASPAAMAQAPPLTLIFHGKTGTYREDGAMSGLFGLVHPKQPWGAGGLQFQPQPRLYLAGHDAPEPADRQCPACHAHV